MKAALYYFSATGNTLVVARDISASLDGAELIPIAKALKSGAGASADVIGIIFPVYMFGLPLIVADFLKGLTVKSGAYVFAVATYGGAQGRALQMAGDILKRRGIALDAGFSVLMPGNYTPLYGAIPEEKQKEMFDKEPVRVKEIAERVRRRETGIMEGSPAIPNFLLYALLYRGGSSQIRKSDRYFWADEKCTRCGLCEKVCPVSDIRLEDGRPVWLGHCEHCMACLQWCPPEAIQYKKSTAGKRRYHHPLIKAADIMGERS